MSPSRQAARLSLSDEMLRCRAEIAMRERMLRDAEYPDEMEGILMGLQDWSSELRLFESDLERQQ